MPSASSVAQSYSRMYNSKSSRDIAGGTPMHHVSQSNILPKSSMLDDTGTLLSSRHSLINFRIRGTI